MERRVTTKEELKKAKENKVDVIIVEGKLAMDLIEARKITKLGKTALAVLTTGIAAGIATAPVTGGISLGLTTALAAPIAVTTGVSIPAIILASFLGVGFIIALFKEYSVEIDIPNKKVIFTKN